MTVNQLSYLRYLEDQRANQAREAEAYRSDIARELEAGRSNQANEMLKLLGLRESRRSNLAQERELHRSNLVRESETNRANVAEEDIKRYSAMYNAMAQEASAALAKSKAEGQDLQNIVTRIDSINDKGAIGEYTDKYIPYSDDPFAPESFADDVVQGVRRIGTDIFSGISSLGDLVADLVKPITNLFG